MSVHNSLSVSIIVLICIQFSAVHAQIVYPDHSYDNNSMVKSTSSAIVNYCSKNNVQKQRWEVPTHLINRNESTIFLLKVQDVKCKNTTLKTYDLNSKNAEINFQFQSDGYLIIGNSNISDYFDTTQYCIARLTDTEVSFKTCNPTCTAEEPCIRKCCPLGSIYNFNANGCSQALSTKWSAKVFKMAKNPNSILPEKQLRKIHPYYRIRLHRTWGSNCIEVISGLPRVQLMPYSKELYEELQAAGVPADATNVFRFRVGLDGKVQYRNTGRKWTPFPHDHYCVDGLTFAHGDEPQNYNNTVDEEILFTCPPPVDPPAREVSEYFGIFAITTSMFALVTVIVYFLLFDKQNIHGWTTMSHSASVFLFYVFLGMAHLTKHDLDLPKTGGCKFIGTLAHFFFISTFCWLLMISFDLWSTFRSISAASRKKGLRRFLGYCSFGWGIPTLVITVAWTLQAEYVDDENSEIAIPMYGDDSCYLSHHFYWEFIYGPNAVLLTVNFALFILTSLKLYQFQKGTEMATQNIRKNRQSFLLFVKLAFFVGVLWIFEIVSFSVSGSEVPWYWQVFDTLNLLQPVAIFVIFVLKWEIINALHERYIVLRPVVYPARKLLQWLCPQEAKKLKPTPSEASHSTRFTSSVNTTKI